MKKIRVIEYTDRWCVGGIEKYITGLVSHLDTGLFQLMIVTGQKEADLFDDTLLRHGIQVQALLRTVFDNPIERVVNTWSRFYRVIRETRPDILHLHICQGVGFVYAYLAKRAGIKTVIAHSHNSSCGHGHKLIKLTGHFIGRKLFQRKVDIRLACSDLAGIWLYGKRSEFRIVNVPIDVEQFRFDEAERERMRRRMRLNEECVILNIGRMDEQKNQLFLIDLFRTFQEKYNSKLFIIGKGKYEQAIRTKISEYHIEDKVYIIEQTSEVEKYFCMADVFVLTSLFEGNPVVLVEAQASGLNCVYSDAITEMAGINENAACVSLSADKRVWVEKIKELLDRKTDRVQGYHNVKGKGYGMEQVVWGMEELYENAV